jgi:two-component system response regulator AtoC
MPTDAPARKPLSEVAHSLPPDHVLFGRSPAMSEVRRLADKVCATNVPVLLCGSGGTGKETIALWIHHHSGYRNGQFVKVNCAAIPGTLLESELFGYEKGAFTGAQASKPGRVEHSDKGTLFLDEIADLEMGLQSKLLHFLQDGSFSRIGDDTERRVDTRLICATNRDLDQEILAGRFRADLFYRINVVRLQLPQLRDRKDDIPALAEYFRVQHEQQFRKESRPLEPRMLEYLQNLNWPGNVRELSNSIARHVLIGPETTFMEGAPASQRPTTARSGHYDHSAGVPLKRIAKNAIKEMERNVILESLRANQWNRRKTALALKISYRALIYKIRDAGLTSRRARTDVPTQQPIFASPTGQ